MRSRSPRRLAAIVVTAGLASVLVIGSVSGADGAVAMSGFAFNPGTVTVEVGDSVTWDNQDGVGHTATGAGGAFDTGTVGAGQSASVTFDTAGTFAYACSIHPAMQGTVVVEAAAAPTDADPTDSAATTPAPTDTVPAARDAGTDAFGIIVGLLAIMGVSMVIGTVAFDRRAKGRDS